MNARSLLGRFSLSRALILLGGAILLAAACTTSSSSSPGAASAPEAGAAAWTPEDTAAVLAVALSAVGEVGGLDLDRRLWLRRTPAVPGVSQEVFAELLRRAPGLMRVEVGREMRQCVEGEPRTLPGSICPIVDDGVIVWFYRLEISGGVAAVGLGQTHSGHASGRSVLLIRGPDGAWVFDRFNGGFMT